MKPGPTDDELLHRFLNGEADAGEVEDLSVRASSDAGLAGRLAGELRFSELLREAVAERTFDIASALESASLPADELLLRVRDGSATAYECAQVVKRLWESPESVRELRRTLAEDEWLRQAVSVSKGEQAFVESLETRMWAETKRDHFVEDFTKRLELELAPTAENVVAFPRSWSVTILKMAGAAAAVALLAFVAGRTAADRLAPPPSALASVLKATPDVAWSEGASPEDDGTLRPGLYELKSGVVSMRLSGGGELTVEGPARFEVGADASAEVHAGIALARMPTNETGIALRSRGLSVSEPARLIGIDARAEGATEAIVFNGGGGICFDGSGKCRELSTFEAVKADHLREKLVDVPYNPRAFSKTWAMMAGVENNLGPVRLELPGSVISAAGGAAGEVRVFVENESFRPVGGLEVDRLVAGEFAVTGANAGEPLESRGELRSYLLQLTPSEDGAEEKEVETSLTFDHPVVGVIFSSERLESSDATVGSLFAGETGRRGMDSGEDEILLSQDRRTLNLRFKGGAQAEQVRVLVALN